MRQEVKKNSNNFLKPEAYGRRSGKKNPKKFQSPWGQSLEVKKSKKKILSPTEPKARREKKF